MSVSSSTVKSVSRKIFKENFINAVVATTILVMTWLVCYYLFAVVYTVTEMAFSSAIYYFSLVFILFPLLLGLIRYYWRMSSGVADNPAAVFYYFSSGHLYLKAFKLIFMVLLRTLCCYAVMYLPVLVLNLITGSWLYKTLNLSMPIWAVNFSNVIYQIPSFWNHPCRTASGAS